MLRLAKRQHGVVTGAQAIGAGLTKSMLESRVRHGRLARIHPGVYCVAGAPRTFSQRAFAAAAWGGAEAVASHASAGHLWGMLEAAPEVAEICSPRKRTRPPPTIRAHFTTDLPRRDCGRLRNVPVTSPARTLIDLAHALPESAVERAFQRGVVTGCVTARSVRERVARLPSRRSRGAAMLRRLLQGAPRDGRLQSPLERIVADVLTCPELPRFDREHPVFATGRVFYLDFAFPHFRVGVEADGRRWHSDARSFERDRARQNVLTAAGWRIVRVTEHQVRTDPDAIRRQVLEVIRQTGGPEVRG